MRVLRLLSVCAVVSLLAVPAFAEATAFQDTFYAELGGSSTDWNRLVGGGGSGWQADIVGGQHIGPCIFYPTPVEAKQPQTDPWGNPNVSLPGWQNQWFYDGKFDPTRYKVVDVNFTYALPDPQMPGGADIVINWSTPNWVDPDPANPSPPMDNAFIGRATVGKAWLLRSDPGTLFEFNGRFDLRDYMREQGIVPFNPEWVSIDIVGYNILLSSPDLPGSFRHYCVPEPSTLALLGTAGLGLLVCVWRRRRS